MMGKTDNTAISSDNVRMARLRIVLCQSITATDNARIMQRFTINIRLQHPGYNAAIYDKYTLSKKQYIYAMPEWAWTVLPAKMH